MADYEATRAAIAIMTAMSDDEDSVVYPAQIAGDYMALDMGPERLSIGMTNLCNLLLVHIEATTKQDGLKVLQDLGRKIADK